MLQAKDQIGSFYYFPALGMHKASGGFGAIKIFSRYRIPVPFAQPAGDHTVLAGDWYKRSHRVYLYKTNTVLNYSCCCILLLITIYVC